MGSAPPEEPPPPPREPSWRCLRWNTRIALIFGGSFTTIFAVVGVIVPLAVASPISPVDDLRLDFSGEAVKARVVSTPKRDSAELRELQVSFTTSGKTIETQVTTASTEAADEASASGSVNVEYLPSRPQVARLQGDDSLPGGMLLAPLFVALLVSPLFAYGLLARRRERILFREGVAALARVAEVMRSGSASNNRSVWLARYEFDVAATPTREPSKPCVFPQSAPSVGSSTTQPNPITTYPYRSHSPDSAHGFR